MNLQLSLLTVFFSLPGLLLVEVVTAPSSLVCFASTLACLKTSSTSMFSTLANRCSTIKMWSGKPLMKAILTVFSRLCPVYPTNPASHLISTVYTSTGSQLVIGLNSPLQKMPSIVFSQYSQHWPGLSLRFPDRPRAHSPPNTSTSMSPHL